jgi:hypothetical protein
VNRRMNGYLPLLLCLLRAPGLGLEKYLVKLQLVPFPGALGSAGMGPAEPGQEAIGQRLGL